MKRLIIFLFVIFGCVLLALWSPWLYWKIDFSGLFGVKKPESIAGLQVFSLSGEVEVFIDSVSQGKVKVETSPMNIDNVTPGEHLISLKRASDATNAYWSFGKLVNFEQNTTVVASYNLGPEEEFSEGHVIYAVKRLDTARLTQLNLITNVEGVSFQFDSGAPEIMTVKSISLPLTLDAQHKIKLTKKGFEPLEFIILPESQEDRDKLKTFDINIEAQLMYQPVEVTQ